MILLQRNSDEEEPLWRLRKLQKTRLAVNREVLMTCLLKHISKYGKLNLTKSKSEEISSQKIRWSLLKKIMKTIPTPQKDGNVQSRKS